MLIDPQIKIYNPKTEVVYKVENDYYTKMKCPWHRHQCLMIVTGHNDMTFHCLYDMPSRQIRYKYYNSSKSCDIPENFHDLIMLHDRLGSEYVLPFVSHYRVTSGETIGLFKLQTPGFGPSIIKPIHLVETFLTHIVLFCETCYRLGGISPVLIDMKFIYTQTHPVLVDINITNSVRRNISKFTEIFSQKKWKTFLTERTSKEIIHYMKLVHASFFKKKRKYRIQTGSPYSGGHQNCSNVCILAENVQFNRITHDVFCINEKTSLYKLLETYKTHVPNLSNKIQTILESVNLNEPTIV